MFRSCQNCRIQLYNRFGFRGEGTNYARSTRLNPQHVAIKIHSNSAIKDHVIHAPHRVEDLNTHHMDREQDRAESSQSKLGNKSVT
jgi:hypothetical protein